MENHHHCKVCGNMISPSKHLCDRCAAKEPANTPLVDAIKNTMDSFNNNDFYKVWIALKTLISICPESIQKKAQPQIESLDKILANVSMKKKAAQLRMLHLTCQEHLSDMEALFKTVVTLLYDGGYLEFGRETK